MFDYLRRLAARIMNRLPPPFLPPEDPYASVREPRRRNPGGRSSAVAVAEPEEDATVRALGQVPRRQDRAS
jgi:hypothetical protein